MGIIDEDHPLWTDPEGHVLEVSIIYLNGQAMAVPVNYVHKAMNEPGARPYIEFTDHNDASIHRSVPYDSDKDLSELTEKEIVAHWKRAELPWQYPEH